MDFYRINTAPIVEKEYCVIMDAPLGTSPRDYKMSLGERMGDDYPPDARVCMSNRYPGARLSTVLANTRSLLIVSRDVKDTIEGVCTNEIEYLPVSVHTRRKQLASRDYFIINPIGTVDCLNLQHSRIEWHGSEVVAVEEHVLDAAKTVSAPDLFRVREDPRTYLISARLGKALAALAPSNFYVTKLAQVQGAGKCRDTLV